MTYREIIKIIEAALLVKVMAENGTDADEKIAVKNLINLIKNTDGLKK